MSFNKDLLPDPLSYYEGQGLSITKRGSKGWRATNCPFCDSCDNGNINLDSGAFHCWGCGVKGGDLVAFHMALHSLDFIDTAKALGAWVEDGKSFNRTKPKAIGASDALDLLEYEIQLAAIAITDHVKGKPTTKEDAARLRVASGRINSVRGAYYE